MNHVSQDPYDAFQWSPRPRIIEESYFAFLVSFQSIWVYGWKYSSIRWLWRQTPLILVTNAAFWHSGLETVAVASDNEQKNPRRSVFQPSGSCWLAVDTDRHVMQSRLWRMINVLIFASKPSVPGQQKPPKIASRHVIDFIRDAPEPQLWADFRLHPAFLDVCNDDCCFWRKMPGFLFGWHAIRMNQNWKWTAKCKKRRQLSLSLINVGHVVSARGGGLWITWFYRLINGDSRQQLLEHAESRGMEKAGRWYRPVSFSHHVDQSVLGREI